MSSFDTHDKLLIKGDFSGIQEFIFNIPSKKAAKTLKGKSFYVQALSGLAIHDLKNTCKGSELIYEGGGNFYMLIPQKYESIIAKKQQDYLLALINDGLTLILTWMPYDNGMAYGKNLQEINKKAQLKSINKFQDSLSFDFFKQKPSENAELTSENKVIEFDKLGEWIVKSVGYEFEVKEKKRGVSKFGQNLNFVNEDTKKKLANTVNGFVPQYDKKDLELLQNNSPTEEKVEDGAIMTFEHIAFYAAERTGTDNLGILSLDVDGLGHVVREKLETIEQNIAFSDALKTFFENKLWAIINKGSFETTKRGEKDPEKKCVYLSIKEQIPFRKSIYPVFVGGDDCFLVGAWDAILELTSLIKKEFDVYVKQDKELKAYNLTFSAGLVMVGSNFPVNQFADLAKNALYQAKKAIKKNSVSFMGYVLSWEEWNKVVELKQKLLTEVIEYDASKGMLNRFMAGKELFEQLQAKMLNKGTIDLSTIADYYYGLRDYRPREVQNDIQKHKQQEFIYFIDTYNDFLTKAFIHQKSINSLIIPLAARWVEFLTRNKDGKSKRPQ